MSRDVTNADRDAAGLILGMKGGANAACMFAAHRLAERDRIVAWLRGNHIGQGLPGVADAIERGEHDQC